MRKTYILRVLKRSAIRDRRGFLAPHCAALESRKTCLWHGATYPFRYFRRSLILVSFLLLSSLTFTPASFALPAEDVLPLIDAEYFPAVHDALAGAKKSILCAMYVAQLSPRHPMGWESMLLRDIVSATKRGLEVKVLLEDDPERENKYAYEFLKGAGVPVYYDGADRLTHSKMIIIDDYISILGSTNWSYNSLRLNHEAAVLIRSKEVAMAFRKAFEAIEVKK